MKSVSLIAALGLLCGLAGPGASGALAITVPTITFAPGDYDNTANTATNNQTTGLFRDVFWDDPTTGGYQDVIHAGKNLTGAHPYAETGLYDALNFKGRAGSAGGTWLTVYDSPPGGPNDLFDASATIRLSLDVSILEYANSKGAGPVALFADGGANKGLSLMLKDNGNSDSARMDLVFQNTDDTQAAAPLSSISLGGSIAEASWYRVQMDLTVTGNTATVVGMIFAHSDPTNPNSALGAQLGSTLNFSGSLTTNLLTNPGEIGIAATGSNITASDNLGISVTNFSEGPVPEPVTMLGLMLGVGGVAGYVRKRRTAADARSPAGRG